MRELTNSAVWVRFHCESAPMAMARFVCSTLPARLSVTRLRMERALVSRFLEARM